ncbi:hypothetical protein NPIL_654241 [Nephila pilipes]|uniref:Uncharacterized protein n=1 Tax=Nephila pilipes TaxID=299642 RepID=A0A8X6NE59_NEPPI|nr:hypothetical protein NPIL_654241 [Nephila pilipes]
MSQYLISPQHRWWGDGHALLAQSLVRPGSTWFNPPQEGYDANNLIKRTCTKNQDEEKSFFPFFSLQSSLSDEEQANIHPLPCFAPLHQKAHTSSSSHFHLLYLCPVVLQYNARPRGTCHPVSHWSKQWSTGCKN